jgi:hypothetical protein
MKKKKYDLTSIFIIVLIFAFLYSIFIFTYSLFKIEKLSFSHQLDFANMDKYSSYLQGIVGLFLNLVTIILVYRTFKQQDDFIIEQRNEAISSKKSEVFFPNKELYVIDQIDSGQWLTFFDDEKMQNKTIKAKVLNIGRSNCKNLKIEWEYELERIFELIDEPGINFLPEHKRAYNININSYRCTIPAKNEFQVRENIDYLLTFDNMSTGRDLRFPVEYLELFIFYWQKMLYSDKTFDGFKLGSNDCFVPLVLKVTYEDAVKKNNTDLYSVDFSIRHFYSKDPENPTPVSVEFHKM